MTHDILTLMNDSSLFLSGFQEATACVQDMEACAASLCKLAGWEIIGTGNIDPRIINGWDCDGVGAFVLLANPGDDRGYLRLHEIAGVEQVPVRSNPQTWDPGGIIDLNVRVLDLPDKYEKLKSAGWYSTADPVRWTFGPAEVEEWIGIGPDGLAIAIIERLAPPLEGWDTLKSFSRVFNSSQIVKDMPAALAFYEEALGFKQALYQRAPLSEEPIANVLGIPLNLVPSTEVEIAILQPFGEMDGSVELVRFHGLEGRDFSETALPWNLGVTGLRFPVSDLDSVLVDAGKWMATPPVEVDLPPYGEVRMAACRAPDGAWLDFYEVL